MKKYYGNKKMKKYYGNERMNTTEENDENEKIETVEAYYAIAALNGCGVYTNVHKLRDTQKYAYGAFVKKFTEYQPAVDFAETTYLRFQLMVYGHVHETERITKTNWLYRPQPQMIKPFVVGSDYLLNR